MSNRTLSRLGSLLREYAAIEAEQSNLHIDKEGLEFFASSEFGLSKEAEYELDNPGVIEQTLKNMRSALLLLSQYSPEDSPDAEHCPLSVYLSSWKGVEDSGSVGTTKR